MDNAIAQRTVTYQAGVKEQLTPAEANRYQDDDLLLAEQLAGITQDLHYPHVVTADYELAHTTGVDKLTITPAQVLVVGGVRYNTSDLTNTEITIPDNWSGFVRAEVAADCGDVVDAGADPIERELTLDLILTTGSVSDSEGTGGGPSSRTSARLYAVTKAGGGTAPVVTAYANNGHGHVVVGSIPHTHDADEVNYDNTASGLSATTVQAALDEVTSEMGGLTLHADTGAADALVITPAPAIAAYAAGQVFWVEPAYDNTGAATLNVNGLGAQSIKLPDGTDPWAKHIRDGYPLRLRYDGTNFVLIDPPPVTKEIDPYANVLNGGTATSWTTISLTSVVPVGTTWVRLWVAISTGTAESAACWLRSSDTGGEGKTGCGRSGDTTNQSASDILTIEISSSRSIDYHTMDPANSATVYVIACGR